jgi:hypothetical protein
MDKLEFPADMPPEVRRVIGTPTADAITAWRATHPQADEPTTAEWVYWLERVADHLDANAYDAQDRAAHGAANDGRGA